ncbi:hypothetical protein BC360_06740 [Ensifer sp. LC163]|nr:hypothetical protein BC360_06740 [Ensifer sp. LC163]
MPADKKRQNAEKGKRHKTMRSSVHFLGSLGGAFDRKAGRLPIRKSALEPADGKAFILQYRHGIGCRRWFYRSSGDQRTTFVALESGRERNAAQRKT